MINPDDTRLHPLPTGRHLPPQLIEAEEAILGAVLLDPGAIERVDQLRPEHFYVAAHGEIFRAMLQVHAQQLPPDFMQVFNNLRDRHKLEGIGGQNRLLALIEHTVSSVAIDLHAELVIQKWQRRQLFRIGQQLCEQAYDQEVPLTAVTETAEQAIAAVSSGGREGVVPFCDSLSAAFTEIEQRSVEGLPPGLLSGFYDLDAMTGGFQAGELAIIAGRPSMGKTAIAMNTLIQAVRQHRKAALFVSLEMSERLISQRLLSAEARIESGRLRAGRVRPDEWEPLGHAISALSPLPVFIDDTPNLTVGEIRSRARRLATKQPLGLLVIDYLQLIGGSSENRVQELSNITRSLKQLARELGIAVIALSQLSRAVEQRTNKRPMMSDLRESGGIEQDADLILMLYRDEYYNPDTPDRGIAEVNIVKHRNGPTGTVKLLFEPQFTQFRNLARGA